MQILKPFEYYKELVRELYKLDPTGKGLRDQIRNAVYVVIYGYGLQNPNNFSI